MAGYPRFSLVDRNLESGKVIRECSDRFTVVDTVKGGVATPVGTSRPLAKHLGLTGILTRRHSGVQAARLHTFLYPFDHGLHIDLGVRSWLKRVVQVQSTTQGLSECTLEKRRKSGASEPESEGRRDITEEDKMPPSCSS